MTFQEFLHSRNLTVCSLARLSGIPKSQISEWKNGRHRPSKSSVHKIAFALRVHPDTLMREIESREKTESWPTPPVHCLLCHRRLSKLPNHEQCDDVRGAETTQEAA
jgi:transcriptional regulator with XRE-family HTH domain